VRIVEHWRAICGLGCVLATAAVTPVFGQTVTVGGDWRPQIVVDTGVLDRLGPEPTLPDMLLGRHPMPVPGGPVQLHRPHHPAGQAAELKRPAEAKPAASERKMASASPKTKPVKLAEATPPSNDNLMPPKTAKSKDQPGKNLISTFDAPPSPPRHTPPPSNADMPTMAPADQGQATASPDHKISTPPAAKPSAAQPTPVTAAQLPTEPAPSKAASATPAPQVASIAKPTPPAAQAPAPAPTPPVAQAPASPAPSAADNKDAGTAKLAMLTPPPQAANTEPGGPNLSITFAVDGADLGDDAKRSLQDVAKRAEADASVQLLILAYSSGDDASKARRLSLSRALVVRSFLKDQGVPSARIEVRALGNKVPEGAPDRVDLVEQKH
jgi:outer membrane protein OmpA-like peptidoglycan-associated protein